MTKPGKYHREIKNLLFRYKDELMFLLTGASVCYEEYCKMYSGKHHPNNPNDVKKDLNYLKDILRLDEGNSVKRLFS